MPTSPSTEKSEAMDMEASGGFESLGVCNQLVEACTALGWTEPTPIQREAIPLALEGKDIIGLAQTGSGKTAAFVVPILQALLEKSHSFFASVLSPTRELAIQIGQQFNALGAGMGLKCAVVVGGVDVMSEMISLGKGPHVVVGTPGRFAFHLSNTKGFSLQRLKFLVLDEADRLLDLDFEKEMDEILKLIPKERQTFLYSATMTSKVAKLQRACLRHPAKVEVSSKHSTVATLRQEYLFIALIRKDRSLVFLLNELAGNMTMVFTNTCIATRRLHLVLCCLGLKAVPISGKMTQPKRLAALNKFKAGEQNILICTDVASRGLDIPSVDLVINYDIPTSSKDYIHRVGRTARAGRSGRAISLVTQYDIRFFLQIESDTGLKLPCYKAEKEEIDVYEKSVSEAQRMATRHMHEHDKDLDRGKKKKFWGYDNDITVDETNQAKRSAMMHHGL